MVHGRLSQTPMPGEFGRRQRQLLLDPHVARDVDDAERAIGEIDHHHRHVAQTERQDRPQQAFQPTPGAC